MHDAFHELININFTPTEYISLLSTFGANVFQYYTLRVDLPEIVEIHTHMKVIKPNVSSFWLIIDLETYISMNIFGALSLYI